MPSSKLCNTDFLSGELGITHFALHVADLDRSMAFYTGLLQLEERNRLEVERVGLTEVFLGGPGGVGGTLDLIHMASSDDEVAPPKGYLTHVTIRVPNLVELRKGFAAAGVTETMAHEVGAMLMVFVTDPDGYHVELIGPRGPRPD